MKKITSWFLALVMVLGLIYQPALSKEKDKEIEINGKGIIDVLVYMEEDSLIRDRNLGEDLLENKEAYVENLQNIAHFSQKDLVDFLEWEKKLGNVISYESFYITNTVHLLAKKEVLHKLINFPGVSSIENNVELDLNEFYISDITEEESVQDPESQSPSPYPWNLEMMNIPRVWEDYGLSGQGVVIGFIDSGFNWENIEIKEKWRGYDPNTGQVTSDGNWVDLVNGEDLPTDISKAGNLAGHGTATVSVALGGYEGSNIKGVAPNAKWIGARAFDGKKSSSSAIIKAAEWMLAPGGDPLKAPDIVNCSWGAEASKDLWFANVLKAWDDVGIISVFAAGNGDMGGADAPDASIENPASMEKAFAVGAVDGSSALCSFSKRGPSIINPDLIKPDVVAPGKAIKVARGIDAYSIMIGTSISAPQIAGIFALIKEFNPQISNQVAKDIILETSKKLTDSTYPASPNMAYGHGLPDVYKAIKKLSSLPEKVRYAGKNRFETAELLASLYFKDADRVYLTSGNSITDALVVSPITKERGPLLLTSKDSVSKSTIDLIKTLKPQKLAVVGGANTISDEVKEILLKETGLPHKRISGKNRYETALEIARDLKKTDDFSEIFLVNGFKEVDAISISGPAIKEGLPILLCQENDLPEGVEKFIEEENIKKITLIGGQGTLSRELENKLVKKGLEVERIGGPNRYSTSLMINQRYYPTFNQVMLANGVSLVDALSAGPIAGRENIPLILLPKDSISPEAKAYINRQDPGRIIFLGGENSLEDRIFREIISR